jgi:hypothetical protein
VVNIIWGLRERSAVGSCTSAGVADVRQVHQTRARSFVIAPQRPPAWRVYERLARSSRAVPSLQDRSVPAVPAVADRSTLTARSRLSYVRLKYVILKVKTDVNRGCWRLFDAGTIVTLDVAALEAYAGRS